MTTRRFVAAVVVLVGVSTGMVLAQANPLIGKWTLNAAKSTGAFKSGTTIVEAVGDGFKMTVELIGTDGTKRNWSFTANYDGKDVPVTGDSPYGDTSSVTRVDARTTRITSKYQGKPTTVHVIVVSPDGKTRTSSVKGTDKTGKPLDAMSFYEKQ
jgi:hypothetical protein